MRVLVVEDEEDLGSVFRDFLSELGHQPLIVRSAEAALGSLRTERPDAIILDINLPGMSGLEFLQLRPIRESGVPIVAVSGMVTENQARECLRLGALDFVGKPVPFDRLGEVLSFLEPQAQQRRADESNRPRDRRRAPRVQVALPVRIAEYKGTSWNGTSVELSVLGMLVASDAPLAPGAVVKLGFTPGDGPAVELIALVVRRGPEGIAFSFVNLPAAEAARLKDLVARRSRS